MANWRRFEDMDLWKKACRLTCDVYRTTTQGAFERDFAFRDQIRRSALSVPSNIAEGFERDSAKAFANFLAIAKDSSGELRTQLYVGCKLGYLTRKHMGQLVARAEEISRMTAGLVSKLKKAQLT
jgi:four helix bundle protein